MYISLNWIKEFVNLDGIEVDEIVKRFGLATAEVEGVEYKGQNISNIVVAEIKSVENHPDSKKLHILQVDDGLENLTQVVCGAPNVRVGMKTAFARVGAQVQDIKIGKAKLAGIESYGMCCGEDEIGIGSDDSGIVDLDSSYKNGTDIKEIFPIDDVIIEVDNKSLTNRPDLWGHYGIAREFATIFKRELKPIDKVDLTAYNNLPKLDVKVETPDCYRYSALTVDNVMIKKSPQVMKIRLNYCGMRDINLLADMTNYLMLELGQPMHAFDNNIVKGIRVITTKEKTPMLTLEGEEHIVDENSTLICDEQYTPVAIAGVKGGLKSGISDSTNSLLLESATFSPVAIRKTSRKIGLITDASLRYEKSLDPEMTTLAIERLVYLLKNIDNGIKVTSSLTDCYNYKYPTNTIKLSAEFINLRGGVNIAERDMIDILNRLGFKVEKLGEELNVIVPSWRATKDVSIKEDLVEEILRMYGYDNINPATMNMPLNPVEQLPIHNFEYKTKRLLAEKYGLNELHSYIWNYKDFNEDMGIKQESVVELLDSSNSGQSGLRSTLLPTTLKFFYENRNNYADISIFEIGRTAESLDENKLVVEKRKLSIVLASMTKSEKELYFTLKQIVEDLSELALTKVNYNVDADVNDYLHPINSCAISSVGEMGVIHPSVAKNLDKRFNIVGLELDLEELLNGEKTTT
ncbi:MAG: phenylalanine--tRNA ligase subunit beta, partial [Clostridia bacterium]|nr:phenylalanine--tRNA ligase subunit beta [Clostridia bacterium]